MSADLLTYADLAKRYGRCERHVRRMCARIGLKPVDLGHKTKLFRPADVARAEDRQATSTTGRAKR